jgi:glycerol-3-phosphate dehydrogenase
VWRLDTDHGVFAARAVINAAGPAVLDLLRAGGEQSERSIRLVRGSHIVVRKLFDHEFAYFFQLPDGRIFFAIPYERDFTLIGTTDADHQGPLDAPRISAEEIEYLCAGVNAYFATPISPADVVWSYSGIRPLIDDGSGRPEVATRGYSFALDGGDGVPPLLSVFGGKITTYRTLAQTAIARLQPYVGVLDAPEWTASVPLPGGDFAKEEAGQLAAALLRDYPFLDQGEAQRLTRAYGTIARQILGDARTRADLGHDFRHGLSEREVTHLIDDEWARDAADVLWRRTKLGLRFTADEAAELDDWMAAELALHRST